jgi:oxygen-independent coproporphyrinogen-3 oxidase
MQNLIQKYDTPTPRYTSYPTVPFWQKHRFSIKKWQNAIQHTANSLEEVDMSLYMHLPFCESLCTYCACNKRITKQHSVEIPYLEAMTKEWKMYQNLIQKKINLKELHLGGGTPTFFSPQNLYQFLKKILSSVQIDVNTEMSVEVHPSSTTPYHLEVLANLGFKRISVGVQDFDPKVQYIINRTQTFTQTQKVIKDARELGYNSVNIDIIYGLPLQTKESIELTMEKVKILKPDRIAFYSYAHVPWKSAGQRRYTEKDLPQGKEKRNLYELGKKILLQEGYIEIGFDHFSLPTDELYNAVQENRLHRNFMGYTIQNTNILIGLGASAISDIGNFFAQNEKEVEDYQQSIEQQQMPIFQGHQHSKEDLILRKHILNLMCQGKTSWEQKNHKTKFIKKSIELLKKLEEDNLVILDKNSVQVTEIGKPFLRNICACFDKYLYEKQNDSLEKQFSKTA